MRQSLLLLLLLLWLVIPAQAQDEDLKVVASFSILADVVRNVTGDDVVSLMPVGADPHSFSPSARDLATLADADVVFINGIGFESGLLRMIENAAPDVKLVVVSACVPVIEIGATLHDHNHEEDDHEDEHVDEEGHDEADSSLAALCEAHADELGEEIHEHDEMTVEPLGRLYEVECSEHGGCDPHVWTNPHNIPYWTLMIRDTLSELDPSNRERYATNAASYIDEVETFIHEFIEPAIATLPAENRVLLTNHETLGYFAAEYGFELVGTVIPGSSTAAEPSASEIAALIDLVRDEGVAAIFAENTVNTRLAQQVASEGGARFYTLYSDSLSEAGGEAATYLDYMRYNVTTIVSALGGQVEN